MNSKQKNKKMFTLYTSLIYIKFCCASINDRVIFKQLDRFRSYC